MANPYPFINPEDVYKTFLEAGTNDPANDADNMMREQAAILLMASDPQMFHELQKLGKQYFTGIPTMGLIIVQMLWSIIEKVDIRASK